MSAPNAGFTAHKKPARGRLVALTYYTLVQGVLDRHFPQRQAALRDTCLCQSSWRCNGKQKLCRAYVLEGEQAKGQRHRVPFWARSTECLGTYVLGGEGKGLYTRRMHKDMFVAGVQQGTYLQLQVRFRLFA